MNNKILIKQLASLKNQEIFFWGASCFLADFILNNDLNKYNIIGIIDSNRDKSGLNFYGYTVFKPEEIKKHNAKIVFTVKNNYLEAYESVTNQLKELGKENSLMPNVFLNNANKKAEIIKTNKLYLRDLSGRRYLVSYIPGLNINWCGENSIVEIGGNPVPNFVGSKITICSNSQVKIGSSQHVIEKLEISVTAQNSKVTIGEDFSSNGAVLWITGGEKGKITIGDDCMFSRQIILRTSDAHAIFDKTTKEILNIGGNIKIGDHVWVAQNVMITKNTNIPKGCVIGANSMVTKKFKEENTLIAGYPADIKKKNIDWVR